MHCELCSELPPVMVFCDRNWRYKARCNCKSERHHEQSAKNDDFMEARPLAYTDQDDDTYPRVNVDVTEGPACAARRSIPNRSHGMT